MAGGPLHDDQSGRQVGDFAGAHAPRLRAPAAAPRRDRRPHRRAGDEGRLVPQLAPRGPRRQHPRRGRRACQRGGLRAPGGLARQQCLSADQFCRAGRKRHARLVRQPDERLRDRGDDPGKARADRLAERHALPRRSGILRLRALHAGAGRGRRPALAPQEEPAPALRRAPRRRLLPELHPAPPLLASRQHGAASWSRRQVRSRPRQKAQTGERQTDERAPASGGRPARRCRRAPRCGALRGRA